MKMYADYLKERDGAELFYNEFGFVVWSEKDDVLYISEIFVKKEHRRTNAVHLLFCEALNRALNYKTVIGSYDISTNNWMHSKKLLIRAGFKYLKQNGNLIFFVCDKNKLNV